MEVLGGMFLFIFVILPFISFLVHAYNKKIRESGREEIREEIRKVERNLYETTQELDDAKKQIIKLNEEKRKFFEYKKRIDAIHQEFITATASNLTAIPYMAAIMADYETYGVEILAKKLDWGYSTERAKKVLAIREIRKKAEEMVQRNLESKYQLEYLLQLFPALEDVIETDYKQLPVVDVEDIKEYDTTRDWLSKEEYQNLSSIERNQLALDRYKASHNKTKWQIGRDYELYVGYLYDKKGYSVDYFGSYMGLEDLGRDLIVRKGTATIIIQCKYWSQHKQIHEKHILQLYGTIICYCLENGEPTSNVKGVLVTNTNLSDTAKKMAEHLGIKYKEHLEKGDYPCIKCNINYDEYGGITKIYHLPFDQKYDVTKIDKKGEFYAMTVEEAEKAGFRRSFRWFGS